LHLNTNEDIIKCADHVLKEAGTRDPDRICRALGIKVIEAPFSRQKGVYKVIARNRYIFLKEDLDPVMRSIVLWHEIGHDRLHRKDISIFQEFNLFEMNSSRMEYEANLFAAQIGLPDEEVLDRIYMGKDVAVIAGELTSDINLVALKVSALTVQGYDLKVPEFTRHYLNSRS